MNVRLAPSLIHLIDALSELPGLGPKSAQRAAFHLLEKDAVRLGRLHDVLGEARLKLHRCARCRTYCEGDLCALCADPRRDRSLLCVVESVPDQLALDASMAWPGLYFILSGRLSPIDDRGPEEVGITELLDRVDAGLHNDELREVVVATSYTPEGDATAYYVIEALRKRAPDLRVTRLARGLPSGIEIEYTDLSTLAGAIYDRRAS